MQCHSQNIYCSCGMSVCCSLGVQIVCDMFMFSLYVQLFYHVTVVAGHTVDRQNATIATLQLQRQRNEIKLHQHPSESQINICAAVTVLRTVLA